MLRNLFILFILLAQQASSCRGTTGQTASSETTVYITASGKCYHVETCHSLSKSKTAISLKDAVDQGYRPCGNCHPPVPDGEDKAK